MMIARKNITKEISADVLEETYKNDFNNIRERIDNCLVDWQLKNTLYAISRFKRNYSKVKDRLTIEQDVNKLIKEWELKDLSISQPSFLFAN
ncbi:MAG: hypothetical protein IPJ81_18305 [Chitinophagaceae bacterium]|nr:hypothetical protein [Chitinophagaceae bacterium]